MGILNLFNKREEKEAPSVRAMSGEAAIFSGFDDPAFLDFIRNGGGGMTESGAHINPKEALKNTTILRCVSLISFSIGMLPLHLQRKADKTNAKDHPLFRILHRKPNSWQTAFEFRSLMQQRALTDGDAFAYIVRSGSRVTQLVPLCRSKVQVTQNDDWSLKYTINPGKVGARVVPQRDMFHLRYGLSEDGYTGLSLVKQSAEAIGLAQQAEKSAARMFKNGMLLGGALKHPGTLSQEAFERLKASMNEDTGAENAHKWKILEEGMELQQITQTGVQSQSLEQRKQQIEEVARPFGVPRPLLGVDDTSWGSGIDVLGQFFVRYSLNPWFEAWQQAIERSLLTEEEADIYEVKFNAGALLRGSMADQAEFFAKGLGSGGHTPWLHPDEARDWLDLPQRDDLPPAAGQDTTGGDDEPA